VPRSSPWRVREPVARRSVAEALEDVLVSILITRGTVMRHVGDRFVPSVNTLPDGRSNTTLARVAHTGQRYRLFFGPESFSTLTNSVIASSRNPSRPYPASNDSPTGTPLDSASGIVTCGKRPTPEREIWAMVRG
jgi:hypothetical protein